MELAVCCSMELNTACQFHQKLLVLSNNENNTFQWRSFVLALAAKKKSK